MLELQLDIKRQEKLSDQLYGQLLEKIVSGELKPGDKLPSENQIARAHQVSRPVIREALLRLQADGLVYSRQGAGSFVKTKPPEGLVRFAAASDVAELLRCYEVRIPLEGAAASLAAQRATKEDLKEIESSLIALENAFGSNGQVDDADFKFHMAVFKATGNDFYALILESLHATIQSGMRVALNITQQSSQERIQKVLEEHRAIYEAITMGDTIAADLAMRYHINRARTRLTNHQRDR